MNLSKIRSLHVMIIGAVVCAIVGVGLFFVLIKPMKAKMADTQAKYDASNQVAMQEPSARMSCEKAIEEAKKAREEYDYFQRTKMPSIDFTDRGQGMLALWREQSIVLGSLLQKWPKRTGVTLLTPIQVPPPPVNPNVLQTEIIEIPIGQIQVRGSFKSILNHLAGWNYFNRLVKIDMPTLSGPSPIMTSQYTLTVYVFPRGKSGAAIPLAGVAGAEQAAGAPGAAMPMGTPMPTTPATPMPPGAGPPGEMSPRMPGEGPVGM